MSSNWTNNPSGNSNTKIQSFLEALRASQDKVSTKSPGENPFSEFYAKKEVEKRRVAEFQNARSQEWSKVFSSKEKETARRMEEIRIQLKQLSTKVRTLNTNIVRAIENPSPEAGEYQIGFLEHLKQTIHQYTLDVNSANGWLEMYNSRSKKMGAYWSGAKSKGNSYTQSNERSVATSIG